jgi:hypothetical protein
MAGTGHQLVILGGGQHWYFNGRRDYNTSFHSYVGTDQPAGNVNTVAMATDLWSKWGGVPFTTSAVIRSLPEAGVTTGDTLR